MKLTTALAAAAFVALPMVAQAAPSLAEVKEFFMAQPQDQRAYVQELMKMQGIYNSTLDGAWGPATQRAYETMLSSKAYAIHDWDRSPIRDVQEAMYFADTITWLEHSGIAYEADAPCDTCD